MKETIARFLIGGILVSMFAVIGDLFKPKSFAGLFGAAPSVALATLALTVASKGPAYTAIESRSMMAGAVALLVYSMVIMRALLRHRMSGTLGTVVFLPVWFAVAFALWFAFLRGAA